MTIKGRAYVTAKTAQTFEGKDLEDVKRQALELFRKDISFGDIENLGAWVEVKVVKQ